MKINEPDAPRDERMREQAADASDPLTTADMAAAARRQPINNEVDERYREEDFESETAPEDRDRGAQARESEAQPRESLASLFDEGTLSEHQSRWSAIQTGFVDDPRRAVEEADQLVAAVMTQLAEVFADERANLEADWAEGEDVSTEDLRVAFRRYRSFFDRLLSV